MRRPPINNHLAFGDLAWLKWTMIAKSLLTARGAHLLSMFMLGMYHGFDLRPSAIMADGIARRKGKRPKHPTTSEKMDEIVRAREVTMETYRMLLPQADALRAQIVAASRADRPLLAMALAMHIWSAAADVFAEILEENGRDDEADNVRGAAAEFAELAALAKAVPMTMD